MPEEKSIQDAERDMTSENWTVLSPFTCTGCRVEKTFPLADAVKA